MTKFISYTLLIFLGSTCLYFLFIAFSEHNFWFMFFGLLLSVPIFIIYNKILQKDRMHHELSHLLNSIYLKKLFEDFYSEQKTNEIKEFIDSHYPNLYKLKSVENLLDNLDIILCSKDLPKDHIQPLETCVIYMRKYIN